MVLGQWSLAQVLCAEMGRKCTVAFSVPATGFITHMLAGTLTLLHTRQETHLRGCCLPLSSPIGAPWQNTTLKFLPEFTLVLLLTSLLLVSLLLVNFPLN